MTIYEKAGGRKCFLDILRVAATCAVVLLHTVTGVMDTTDMSLYPTEKKVFLVILDLITWCVPIFILISGYLFLNPDREITFMQMLKKYCKRIVLALFLFGVPYACMEQIALEHTFRLEMAGKSIVMVFLGKTWSHMWYLYLILFLYLITPGLKMLLKKMPVPLLYGILAVLFLGSSVVPFIKKLCGLEELPALPDGGIYLFYYLCGYLFARSAARRGGAGSLFDKKGRKYILPACMALLAAGMAVSRLGTYSVQMAYNYPFTVLLSLMLMSTAGQAEAKLCTKNTALWKNLGALCFGVYLIHPVFVNILYKFLHITLLDFQVGLSLPLFFTVILFLSLGAAWVLYKIPLLRKYVL